MEPNSNVPCPGCQRPLRYDFMAVGGGVQIISICPSCARPPAQCECDDVGTAPIRPSDRPDPVELVDRGGSDVELERRQSWLQMLAESLRRWKERWFQ